MSDKNFEEKLKQHWREEADSIPVPDSLHPAKIEEMIDKKMEVPKKRTHKKLYAGITAAAACLALLIAGTAYYFNTGVCQICCKENRILSEKWNSSGRTSDTYF